MNKSITPFVGESSFTKEIKSLIQNLSQNNASVLLIGERGSGKRLIAQYIHYSIAKSFGYFFEINCLSFNKEQILLAFETVSKLISYDQRITLFVSFLDEMSLDIQNDFLELINRTTQKGMNLKIICSLENSIEEKVSDGEFSAELFYKINTVILNVLPLRQRKEDIIPIAENYLRSFSKKSGMNFESFSDNAKAAMLEHFWEGNADELINSVQRAFIVGKPPLIRDVDLGFSNSNAVVQNVIGGNTEDKTLKTAIDMFKKEYITMILEECGWNQTKAAKILGIQRTYVIRLINELQIRK